MYTVLIILAALILIALVIFCYGVWRLVEIKVYQTELDRVSVDLKATKDAEEVRLIMKRFDEVKRPYELKK